MERRRVKLSVTSEDWAETSENATYPADFVQIQHIQHQWSPLEYPHGSFAYFQEYNDSFLRFKGHVISHTKQNRL